MENTPIHIDELLDGGEEAVRQNVIFSLGKPSKGKWHGGLYIKWRNKKNRAINAFGETKKSVADSLLIQARREAEWKYKR